MKNNSTAIAIVIGFTLVAGAIFVNGNQQSLNNGAGNTVAMNSNHSGAQAAQPSGSPKRENREHAFVYGNPDAAITVVEFSDFECPFCSRLHPTLERLVDESDGKINWEYRHLPLPSHRNAELAAEVGECVGRLKGNEAFWDYSGLVFSNYSSVNSTFLTETAGTLGVSESELQLCLSDEAISNQVAVDLATARSFGGNGTPFSVIVFPDGTTQPISGALPYERWVPLLSI